MDSKTLLALLEANPGTNFVMELPDLSNDPTVLRKAAEARKSLRPECFPPELKHLAPKPGEIDFSADE